ncbi:cytochrome p450 [Diaporthe amygdali]|uniref:cytochrome p450 n=1 Tax=Phomopsis amygdali TaxID=1214568 RepID=UPI0022FEAD1A|nr:cytochrome p450 [Diaporthe amygdali]KAJ0109813.1 cytochrome p450 [Diaporthe amygdali]
MSFLTGWTAIWAVGFALIALILQSIFRKSGITRGGAPLRKPPNTLPLAGNGILFLQARQKLFSWFVKCERIFGHETFELYVPSLPPGVVINDPANLDYVFKNEAIFSKGDFVKKPLWDLFGHGIINSDGELWKVQRKAGLAFLNTKNLQVLTDVALPQYLAQSVDILKSRSQDVREADLQAVFHEITTQLMGKLAYNLEMHADDDFTLAFDYASGATAERVQNPLWRVTEIFFGARLRKSIAIVKAYGKRIVDTAIQDRERGAKDTANASGQPEKDEKLDKISGSLIQSLLDSIGDRGMVADAALNYLSAGRDTTAQALTWTFHLLMHHRYTLAKIRQEVQQALEAQPAQPEGASATSTLPVDPTLFTPASMPYTLAVFSEALRLYPPIPFEIKQTMSPTTLPDGTFLPQGSVVVWCPWAMNRSRLTWGEDADDFRPERWLVAAGGDANPPSVVLQKSASEFPVFNGGPRLCLGKKMAELIAVQVIATVAWVFEFVPAYEGRERASKSSLTLPMEGGLPVFVKVRSRGGRDAL